MASTKVLEQPRPAIITMSRNEVFKVVAVGALLGLVTYCIYIVLDRYILSSVLCGETMGIVERCESKITYASSIAMVVGAVIAMLAMVRMRIYRPLLVVLGASASLWGIFSIAVSLQWLVSALLIVALFSVAYVTFVWLARIRNFYMAAGLSLILLVVVRLVITS